MIEPEPNRTLRILHGVVNAIAAAVLGAGLGLMMSVLALLVGVIRLTIAVINGVKVEIGDLTFIIGYVAAFVVGGFAGGLLWPIRRWIGGFYGLGIFGMTFVAGAFGLHEFGPPHKWEIFEWFIWGIFSIVFGLAVGHGLTISPVPDNHGLTSG